MLHRQMFLDVAGLLVANVFGSNQFRAFFELISEPTPNNGMAAPVGTFGYSAVFNTQIDSGTAQPAESLTAGSFVTLDEFPGLITSTLNPSFSSLFTLTQQNLGNNPPFTGAPDSATLPNFTLTYNRPTINTNTSYSNVFTLTSSLTGTSPGSGSFAGQDTKV